MKKFLQLVIWLLCLNVAQAQLITISGVTVTGRFNSCSGNNLPVVTANLISTSGGSSVVGGAFNCINTCDSSTIRVTISNVKWNKNPNAEWLHGLFLPANAGFSVSPISIPFGFVTYNTGCVGLCPSGSGVNGGPGFYFDNTASNTCCPGITINDGIPCNNYGDVTIGCNAALSLTFDLTFCNSLITSSSYQFVLHGSSDGETGCYNFNDGLPHNLTFTIPTIPCTTANLNLLASNPVRTCTGATENYTSTLTGTCNANNIHWWTAAVGGTLLGTGSPFVYDPAGSACPSGTTIYATCCNGSSTTCVARSAVTIPGVCNPLSISGVTSSNTICGVLASINSVSVLNAQGAVNYTLTPGGITNSSGVFTGLNQTAYTVTVSDASGCTASTTVTLIQIPQIVFSTPIITNVTCTNPNAGQIVVSATGGVGSIIYSINPVATQIPSGTFTGLSAQSYTITATDATSCTKSTVVLLPTPPILAWSNFSHTNNTCTGSNNGSITALSTGGTGSITYTLQPSAIFNSSGIFTGLGSQTYTVVATDTYGCTISSVTTIANPPPLNWSPVVVNNTTCSYLNNGSVTILATGGSPALQYQILPIGTINATGIFNGLAAGTYTIKVTDANSCSLTTSVLINQAPPINLSSLTSTTPLCNGGTGLITAIASGGTGLLTFTLSPGSISNATGIFPNQLAGIYTVIVTDNNSCSTSSSITINQPPILVFTVSTFVSPLCNGANNGSINVTAIGGTGSKNYTLQPGGINNTSGIFTGLTSQTYTILATDANGCTKSTSIIITQPPLLTWSSVTPTNVSCNGGNNGGIAATAGGGSGTITYTLLPGSISNTSGVFGTLTAQSYTIIASDANGCTKSTLVTITQPPILSWTSVVKTNVSCNGGNNGSITATAGGGSGTLSYSLQPGSITNTSGSFTSLTAQSYVITVTDGNGCTKSSSVIITQPTPLVISSITNTIPTCVPGNDAILTVTGSGGTLSYQYSIGGPNQTSNVFPNLGAGVYTVKITDANGCTVTSLQSIIAPNAPVFSNVSSTNVLCNGGNTGSITATATGGTGAITYLLQPGGVSNSSGNFSGLTAQSYTVKATDNIGCSVSTIVTITQPPLLTWSLVTPTNVSCNGGNNGGIAATAGGGSGMITYTLLPGSISNTSGVFGTLTAQSYTIIASDANGCTKSTLVTITQPAVLSWTSVVKTNVSCNGGNNGSITATAGGGSGTLSYSLQPGSITNTSGIFPSLTAQSYIITVTDGNGCTKSSSVIITQPTPLVISSITNTIPTCVPGNDATLTVTGSGGTLSYQYSIGGPNQTSNVFPNLGAGVYTVKITDANGCTVTSLQSIIAPNAPVFSNVSSTNVLCNGGNTGSITATATGGTGAITYLLQPGGVSNSSGNFGSLTAQSYTVKATDNVGCSVSTVVTITQPPLLTWSSVTPTNVSCNGGNNGGIAATAGGGSGTITYTLLPGSISNTSGVFGTLTAQSYTIIASDANGCTKSTLVTITQPPILSWTSVVKTNVSCNGGNNGSITATAGGGSGTLSYSLQPGSITNTSGSFTSLTAQSYVITVTDGNGCTKSSSVIITQPTPLVISSITNTIPTCVPGNDAILTVTGSGGTLSYQYSIGGPNQTSNVFPNLGAGVYTVKITDANGCTVTSLQSIIAPNAPVFSNVSSTNVLCNGGNTGSITATATGGTGAITYLLQPGGVSNSSGNFGSLTAQSYTVKATDNVGCSVSTVVTITQPPLLTWSSVTPTNVSCNGGNNGGIAATAGGGSGTITYTLLPGSISNSSGVFGTLTAQSYTIIASDANGCTKSTLVTITQPPILSWTSVVKTNVSCNGGNNGSITATAGGGSGTLSYSLQPGSITNTSGSFTSLTAQSYVITVTDANGCSKSSSVIITQPTPLVISGITNTIPTCVPGNDAILTVTGSGGTLSYQYSIGGPNQTSNVFPNLGAGVYTVKITDANGCTVTSLQSIIAPNAPVFSNVSSTNVLCNGGNTGSITATATGGTGAITYLLQPGGVSNSSGNFSGLTAQSYTVKATDNVGCSVSTVVTITQPPLLTWSSVTPTNVSCNGGNNGGIAATAGGGSGTITYTLLPGSISNTSGVFGTLTAQSYTIIASDANGCTKSTLVTITQPPILSWTSVVKTNVSCNGGNNGSITATAGGGSGTLSYSLQPGSITNTSGIFASLTAQSYVITVTDGNGCTKSSSVIITQPTPLVISSITNTIPTCVPGNDATLTVTGSGGTLSYQYSIGGPNQTSNVFPNLGAGVYTVKITDANGCTVTSLQSIIAPNAPVFSNVSSTNVLCNGGNTGSITATATGGTGAITYLLQPGGVSNSSGNFSGLTAQTYTVKATDNVGCSVSTVVTITQPPLLTWSSVTPTNVSCNGGNNGGIAATAGGGSGTITYTLLPGSISNTSGVFGTLTAQSYTIIASDANGCTKSTLVTITQPPILSWTSVVKTNVSCNGGNNGSITATAGGGSGTLSYSLQPGSITNTSGIFASLTAQSYVITVTDGNGCTKSSSVIITQPTPLVISSITNTIPTCVPGNDATLTVTGSGGTLNYQYSIGGPNQTSNVFPNLGAGVYTVKITDANGCTVTSLQSIIAPNAPVFSNVSSTNVLCNGGNTGSITATATGGTGAITYLLQPGGVSNSSGNFSGLTAQTYTVKATDNVGCSVSTVVTITQPPLLTWSSVTPTNVSCNGGNNGGIAATAGGGSGTITYTLLPGSISNTSGVFGTLTAQSYTIIASDANGCTKSTLVTITQPPILSWTSVVKTNVSCNGGNNGSITATAGGGSGTLSYSLQPGSITNTSGSFTSLTAQSYIITVTDGNGCTKSSSVIITQPTPLVISSITNTIPTCVPGNDAILTVTGSGGTLSYQYSIGGPNQTSNVFTNLGPGVYTITITDANGCTVTSVQSIVAPNSPIINSVSLTNATCLPGNDGSATISVIGGTGTYTYSADGITFQTSNIITGLSATTYTIIVKDAVGCTNSSVISILTQSPPSITAVGLTNASCIPGCDGTAIISAIGPSTLFSYSLDGLNFQSNSSFTSLCANNYTVTIKDANGCTATSAFLIPTSNGPTISISNFSNVLCNGGSNGSILASAIGGTGVITYTLQPSGSSNNSGLFTSLPASTYTVTVGDVNGCTMNTIVQITEPPLLQFNGISANGTLCSGSASGTIDAPTLGGTGTINYSITPSAIFVAPYSFSGLLGNTTYTITATDGNACSITTAIFISQANAIVINNPIVSNVSCNGASDGNIQILAIGGTGSLNYTLQPGAITNTTGVFNSLAGGLYTITVSDANNCTLSTTVLVTEPPAIVLSSLLIDDISCNNLVDGEITITCSGGIGILTYTLLPNNISNTSGIFPNLGALTYTIVVTDATNCTFTTLATVINPLPLVFASISSSNVLCFGDSNASIIVSGSGGTGSYTYSINPMSSTNTIGQFNLLPVNVYTITSSDANNCSITTSITITQPPILNGLVVSTQNVTCYGGSNGACSVNAIGGVSPYQYSLVPGTISNNTGIFNNISAAVYTVNIIDSNGCYYNLYPINITEPPQLNWTSVTYQDIACFGSNEGAITVNALGGTGNLTYSILPIAGLQSTPGGFTNLSANNYTVTVTDAAGCTATTLVTIHQNPELLLTQVLFELPTCHGDLDGAISAIANGGVAPLTYQLNGGTSSSTANYTGLAAGAYTVTVTDILGCKKDSIVILDEPDLVTGEFEITPLSCVGANNGEVLIKGMGGTGHLTYYMTPGLHINQSGVFTNLTAGNYQVIIKDSLGCSMDTTIELILSPNALSLTVDKKDLTCFGNGIEGWAHANVSGGEEPYNYLWSTTPPQTTATIDHLSFGIYMVEVSDINGCTSKDTIYIEPGDCCEQVFIPNAFSPNGDGVNDVFRVTTSAGIELLQFAIYDRWGNKVWSTIDYREAWDGTNIGKEEDMNTFYYIFHYICLTDKQKYMRKGDVMIVR